MEKIGFISLGCSKNLIDTEVMLGILKKRRMEITEDLAVADVIIVNTCTFIEKAKEESIRTILDAARYKTEGNCRILIVTGCLSQQYKEQLLEEMPEIDALLGTGSWDRVGEAIDEVRRGRKACYMDDVSHLYDETMRSLPVPEETEPLDELATAAGLVEKRFSRGAADPRKIARFLQYRGFSPGVISEIIGHVE